MLFRGLFDQTEQRRVFFFSVDDKLSVEYFVAAVLRIDLRKTEHLAVGQFPAQPSAQLFEVGDFVITEGESLLLVVCDHIVDVYDRVGLLADCIDVLIDRMVFSAQHRVERSLFVVGFNELFDTFDTLQTHVLRDLYGVGTPRSDHFATRTDEYTRDTFRVDAVGTSEQPL